jgi:hypothetical protein
VSPRWRRPSGDRGSALGDSGLTLAVGERETVEGIVDAVVAIAQCGPINISNGALRYGQIVVNGEWLLRGICARRRSTTCHQD